MDVSDDQLQGREKAGVAQTEKVQPHVLIEITDGFHDAKQKFDIVAVHGLHSLNENSWAGEEQSSWLKSLAVSQKWEVRVIRYGWSTNHLATSMYTREAISREALKLLETIFELRVEQNPSLPLAFFAHDVGGIIVKEALFLAGQHGNKFVDIRCSTRNLVFFGCPHRSRSREHMETNIARFLLAKEERESTIQDARSLSNSIIAVNNSFLQTRMLTRATIANCVSRMDSIYKQVFDKSTTSLFTPLEVVVDIRKSHAELSHKPKDDELLEIANGVTERTTSFPWHNDGISPFIDVIESQAAPVYPLQTICDSVHRFRWLDQNEVFQQWRKNRRTYFLHIHGLPDTSDAGEYVYQLLNEERKDKSRANILYFRFDKHDIRRNSIKAMANTFLSQIFSQFRDSPSLLEHLEPPDFSDCWTDRDAFFFLDKIRRCLGNAGRVIWIIDSLDQCDESNRWFFSEMLSIATRSEQYFKVVFTSVDDNFINEALSEFPSIDLRETESKVLTKGNASNPSLVEIFRIQPQLSYFESEIWDLISSCGNDRQMPFLLLGWLQGTQFATKQAMEQEIRSLSSTSAERISQKIVERILETVKEDRRPWARKVIMWILFSIRSITPQELEGALAMDEITNSSTTAIITSFDIMQEVDKCFGPLFVVNNGEICLGHPSVRVLFSCENRDALLDDHRPWYLLDPPEENHRKIVDICLRYLALPSTQDQMVVACKASPNDQPIFEGQSDFLSYAIQFWPHHCRLAYAKFLDIQASEGVSKFLRNEKVLQRWSAANWYFSNPHIRSDRSFLSPLPIIASLGMEELVNELMEYKQPDEVKLAAMALTEASRNGHWVVVDAILKNRSMKQPDYLEAILSAARSAEFDILGNLLRHMKAKFKEIWLPNMIASRVAFFGADVLLKTLIDSGIEVNPQAQSDCTPPLHCAVMRNKISTVDILLKHDAEPNAPNSNWLDCPPMVIAAKFGHAAMVKSLVEAGASVESKDSEGRSTLWWAIILGQHEAVQTLLDASVDTSSILLAQEEDRPLFLNAIRTSFLKCTAALLNSGIDPNIPRMEKRSVDALGAAARKGDVEICRLLIKHGAEVNGSQSYNPIIHAVKSGKREVLDMFIDMGADVNKMVNNSVLTKNDRACTPLFTAVIQNFSEFVNVLLEKNAAVNTALSSGVTALSAAVDLGHTEIVKILIAAGADITVVADSNNWGVVHRAYKYAECMKVLLDAGADINATTRQNCTALYLATYYEFSDVVELLISRNANLELRYSEENLWYDSHTSLHTAARLGHAKLVRILLEAGADINSKLLRTGPGQSWTALMLAVSRGNEECVKVLLEYNPDLESTEKDNDTAVLKVSPSPSLPIVKMMINRGANIEHRGWRNYTVLSRAVSSASIEIVKYLVEKRANINLTGGYRGGPLHIAASMGKIDILKLFIEKGGDVNLADPMVGTPLQVAFNPWTDIADEDFRNTIVQYLIEEAGADVNAYGGWFGSALNAACLRNSLEHIIIIIQKGADVNWPDNFGRRPIHYASLKTIDHIRLLLDAAADITAKTKTGYSALHIAAATGDLDVAEFILSKSADSINEPDDDGWTPLMWACRICGRWGTSPTIEASVIKLLLSHGADIWARGSTSDSQWSPLKLARYHGASEEIIKLLKPKVMHRTTSGGEKQVWDESFHISRRANLQNAFCDVCLFAIYGTEQTCKDCVDPFCICFKCWGHKEELHPQHDNWEVREVEYSDASVEEEAKDNEIVESGKELVERVEEDDDEGDWSNDSDA